MKPARIVSAIAVVLLVASRLGASGPLGIYGIVERVVFEPNDNAPERIQVWGAFAYVDGGAGRNLGVSPAKRGYLYFTLPPTGSRAADASPMETVRKEWADLKAVAGTGQAVGFGSWGYIGAFGALQPDARSKSVPPYILENTPGNPETDLRVRPAAESPAAPATYQTNAGLVKLSETGSHAELVKQLKDALKN